MNIINQFQRHPPKDALGKKTNHVQWHVTAHFSGIQGIQAKAKQALYPPEVF
jgi:hypothetical protein